MKPMLRPINIQILAVLLIISLAKSIESESESCDVGVQSPWTRPVYIPYGSTTQINCTVPSNDQTPVWTILLSGTQTAVQFSFPQSINLLNRHGFYQLPTVETETSKTIRLLINVTDENNGTNILCEDINSSGRLIDDTTLFISDLIPVKFLLVIIVDPQTFNISWIPSPSENQNQTYIYSLTITTSNSISQTFQTDGLFFVYEVPENAPVCEVYNFSVTATYVGATYTGAGCSEPFSIAVHSLGLPNISRIESSLYYSVEKHSTDGVTLNVFFGTPARSCHTYPIVEYILEVQGPTVHRSQVVRTSSNSYNISVGNLLHDQIYTFRITVSNAVGNVSTDYRNIYTTDIQMITAVSHMNTNMFEITLKCTFATGSSALGCIAVLISEHKNITCNLTRSNNTNHVEETFNLSQPLYCYSQLLGYDIEFDGSVGSLAVPGIIMKNFSTTAPCKTSEMKPSPIFPLWKLGTILSVTTVFIFLLILSVVIVVCHYKTSKGDTDAIDMNPNHELYGIQSSCNDTVSSSSSTNEVAIEPCYENLFIGTTNNEVYEIRTDGIEITPNEVYGIRADGIETTPNEVYGIRTDGIETTPNEVYGIRADGIETTPNEVYGIRTDGIETTPNEVYGIRADGIETTPNEVYGIRTDGIETTPNEVYGIRADGIETTPNEVYGIRTVSL